MTKLNHVDLALKNQSTPGAVVCACNPSTQEAGAGKSQGQQNPIPKKPTNQQINK
jgi:hypothetical protein